MHKPTLAVAILAATTQAHAINQACRGDSLKPEGDKRAHLEYSIVIGAASRAVIKDPLLAFSASLLPGLYREGWRGSCFSFQDMTYNAIGSAIGVTSEHWLIGPGRVIYTTTF